VSLTLHSRCVGDVTVVTCSGRIVAGEESRSLRACLERLLPQSPHVLLHLGGVDLIDSGGLGLIARYLTQTQQGQGTLKVCAVSPKINDVLRITRLKSVFQPYETEADSIEDMHRRAQGSDPFEDPDVLCVDESQDVLTYLRELLKEAGYRTLTAANVPDALILLKATRPRLVVIGSELRGASAARASDEFNRVASAGRVIELPAGFSSQDAGEAARQILQAVRGHEKARPF
jgi:anti-sigma B factor antagonist